MIRAESFSSISTFIRCPLSYKIKYIKGLQGEVTEAMERGKRIHEEVQMGKTNTEQAKFARNVYKKTGKGYYNIADITQISTNFAEMKLGIKLVDNQFVTCDFDAKECYYRGIADLVILYYKKNADLTIKIDKIEIIDWKTGKSSGNRQQLISYAYMLDKMVDCKEITCKFVYLDKEKISRPIMITKKELENFEDWLLKEVEYIRTCQSFPAYYKNYGCAWCPNQEECEKENSLVSKDSEESCQTFLSTLLEKG